MDIVNTWLIWKRLNVLYHNWGVWWKMMNKISELYESKSQRILELDSGTDASRALRLAVGRVDSGYEYTWSTSSLSGMRGKE